MIDHDQSEIRRIVLQGDGWNVKGVEHVLVPRDLLDRITRDFVVDDFVPRPPRCCR